MKKSVLDVMNVLGGSDDGSITFNIQISGTTATYRILGVRDTGMSGVVVGTETFYFAGNPSTLELRARRNEFSSTTTVDENSMYTIRITQPELVLYLYVNGERLI